MNAGDKLLFILLKAPTQEVQYYLINTNVVYSLNYCMENLKGGQNSTTMSKQFWDDTLHQLFTQNWCTNIEKEYNIFLRMIMTTSNYEPQYTVPYAVLGSI